MPPSARTRLGPAEYAALVRRIRSAVAGALPERARVLVVGKGDREIARLGARQVSHFPQDETGQYAGFHPADAASAIAHLDALRSAGAEYLLLPRTSYWWQEHYRPLFEHLGRVGQRVELATDDCRIWALGASASPRPPGAKPATDPDSIRGGRYTADEASEPLDPRIEAILAALFDRRERIIHLRERGDLAVYSGSREVRSVPLPEEGLRALPALLAKLRAEGAAALLLLARPADRGWASPIEPTLHAAVGRWLPRIAHRDLLCSLFDLGGTRDAAHPLTDTPDHGAADA